MPLLVLIVFAVMLILSPRTFFATLVASALVYWLSPPGWKRTFAERRAEREAARHGDHE